MIDPVCKHCGGLVRIRNPRGDCDHLYWPENLTTEAKVANGIKHTPSDALELCYLIQALYFRNASGEEIMDAVRPIMQELEMKEWNL